MEYLDRNMKIKTQLELQGINTNFEDYKGIGNGMIVNSRDVKGYNTENVLYGYVNIQGTQIISPQYINATKFDNGVALVQTNYYFAIINTLGDELVRLPNHYTNTKNIIDGFIPVCDGNKWGLLKFNINTYELDVVMKCVWDFVEDPVNGEPLIGKFLKIDKSICPNNDEFCNFLYMRTNNFSGSKTELLKMDSRMKPPYDYYMIQNHDDRYTEEDYCLFEREEKFRFNTLIKKRKK